MGEMIRRASGFKHLASRPAADHGIQTGQGDVDFDAGRRTVQQVGAEAMTDVTVHVARSDWVFAS
jgi:hypothetical protein